LSEQYTGFNEADVKRVAAAMERHLGPERAITQNDFVREVGMPERKVRAILAAYDGEAILLGKNGDGIFLATSPEQAAAFSAELDAKIWTQLKRRSRRKRLARAMFVRPVEQLGLGIAS
jgi:hypothetical protein